MQMVAKSAGPFAGWANIIHQLIPTKRETLASSLRPPRPRLPGCYWSRFRRTEVTQVPAAECRMANIGSQSASRQLQLRAERLAEASSANIEYQIKTSRMTSSCCCYCGYYVSLDDELSQKTRLHRTLIDGSVGSSDPIRLQQQQLLTITNHVHVRGRTRFVVCCLPCRSNKSWPRRHRAQPEAAHLATQPPTTSSWLFINRLLTLLSCSNGRSVCPWLVGPANWAARASGPSTGGLGAASLLARRRSSRSYGCLLLAARR